MGAVIFTHDQRTGGIHVNAVDNAGSDNAVDAGQIVTAVEHQCIHKGPAVVTRRRVHYHALWLVDNDDVLILVQDVQRNVLNGYFRLFQLGDSHFYTVIKTKPVIGFYRLSIDFYQIVFDQFLDM